MKLSSKQLRSIIRSTILRLDENFNPDLFEPDIEQIYRYDSDEQRDSKSKIETQAQKTINYIRNSLKLTNRVEDKLVYGQHTGIGGIVKTGKSEGYVQGLTQEDVALYEQRKQEVQSAFNQILKDAINTTLSGSSKEFSSDKIVELINYVGANFSGLSSFDPEVVSVARKILHKTLIILYSQCCSTRQKQRQQHRQYKKDFMKDNQQLIKNFTGQHVMGFGYTGSASYGLLGKIISFIKTRNPSDEESVWVLLKEPVKPGKYFNVQQPSFEFSGPITGIFATGDAQTDRKDGGAGSIMSRAGGQSVDDIQAGSRFVKHPGTAELEQTSTSKTFPGEWDELRAYYEKLKSGDKYYVEGTMVGKVKAIMLNERQMELLTSDYKQGLDDARRGNPIKDNTKLQLVFALNKLIRKDKIVFKNLMLEQISPPFPNVTSEAEILKRSDLNLPPKPRVPFDLNMPTRAINGQVHNALLKGRITLKDSFEKYASSGTLDDHLKSSAGILRHLLSGRNKVFIESRDNAGNSSWFNIMNERSFVELMRYYNARLQGFKLEKK